MQGLMTKKAVNAAIKMLNETYREKVKSLVPKKHSKGCNYTICNCGVDLFGNKIWTYFSSATTNQLKIEIKNYELCLREVKK